mmetsp:Transcript_14225/g.40735  ORF Transcript_14225/g.40735 Transcript_14225/m.40735 type:complete len:1022 (+) Transcript_14225:2-3067(+)
MCEPDTFETALAEELVKLHRRLLVEHRRYSVSHSHAKDRSDSKRRSEEITTIESLNVGPAVEGQDEKQEDALLGPAGPGGEEGLAFASEDATPEETQAAAEVGEIEKVQEDGAAERLESVSDSNSERDMNAVEEEPQGSLHFESEKSQDHIEDSETLATHLTTITDLPSIPESVKMHPVKAAAAATAVLRAHKAAAAEQRAARPSTASASLEKFHRGMAKGNVSFARGGGAPGRLEQTEHDRHMSPASPTRGRWRRNSVNNINSLGAEARSDRKPTLANLTDQLALELRADMRRPSISSLRSSGNHSVTSSRLSHGFCLLPVWKRSVLLNARSRLMSACHVGPLVRRNSTIVGLVNGPDEVTGGVNLGEDSALGHLMMSPSALPRLCWDFAAMLLIIYDCLIIPLMVFDDELSFALSMVWMTRLFWTFNIPISAMTGFLNKDGTVEMRPAHVAWNYCKTWCVMDIIVVGIDWAEVVVQSGGVGWSRFGNVLRLLRIVRVVRIVRFIKAPEMMDFFNEYIRSEQVLLIASLGKVILLTLSVAHVVACLWYGVGRISSSDDRRWIKQSQTEDLGLMQQYLLSFHWSLAQFAGELVIEPQNETERAFTVVVLFLAIIGSSMFVSSLTTSMTRLQFLSSKHTSQLATLRRFLLDRNISRPLATRVQQNAQFALQEQKKDIPEASVDLLNLISNPLLVELHFEIYSHVLLEHPFFACYNHINPGGVQKVCHQAVKLFTMYKGDLLFSDFEVPSSKRMYFIVNGGLHYSQPRRLATPASKGMWMCEAFLWTHWSHCGTARAAQTSRLLALDAEKFQTLVSTFPTPHARHYAELFVEAMNEFEIDELSDLETLLEELDDLIEEAFPVEEEDCCESDAGTGSRDSRAFDDSEERRGSFMRQNSSRRSGELSRLTSKSTKSLQPGMPQRKLSSSTRHSRATQVAKRLSKLTRKGSMTERGPSAGRFLRRSWFGYGGLLEDWCQRCSCCSAQCGWWVRDMFGRLWAWRRGGFRGQRGGGVEPFQTAMPSMP